MYDGEYVVKVIKNSNKNYKAEIKSKIVHWIFIFYILTVTSVTRISVIV